MQRASAPLDAAAVAAAARELASRDPHLALLLEAHGVPPLWLKGPGFETLVDIVLGQQVSLTSARRALERVRAAAGSVTPGGAHRAGRGRASGRRTDASEGALPGRTGRGVDDRPPGPRRRGDLPDEAATAALTAHTGVGRWTADIYLLMGLARPDVWASTDLALIVQTRRLLGLMPDASATQVAVVAESWSPYRSVAARMLWQAYLIERGRPLDE